MTFGEILVSVIDGTPGALAGAIMCTDGIPVEEYQVDGADVDLTAIAVEFERVLSQARKVSGAVYGESGGALHELMLQTAEHQLLFRPIDDEYLLIVALTPTGLLGKARFLVRSVLDELRGEL